MAVQAELTPDISLVRPGVVLGTTASGEPVTVPFFTGGRGTHGALIGDAALPRLIALRALDAGARLQVVTSRPEQWLRLRGCAGLSADRMAVRPDTPSPANAAMAAPLMIIDDTSAANPVTVAGMRGLDAIVLHRSSPACRAIVAAALRLPDQVVRSLQGIPRDVVAIASPGMVRLVPLRVDASEGAMLRQSTPPPDTAIGMPMIACAFSVYGHGPLSRVLR